MITARDQRGRPTLVVKVTRISGLPGLGHLDVGDDARDNVADPCGSRESLDRSGRLAACDLTGLRGCVVVCARGCCRPRPGPAPAS